MRFLLYTHSLISDWNHGNAHFLRGILRELAARGFETLALEPEDGWSRSNLIREQGAAAADSFGETFPDLTVRTYDAAFDHEAALAAADVVLVHEWTDPGLVARIGTARRCGGDFTLLFHDTHHRAVSAERSIADLLLADYDAILAFGDTLRQRYLAAGWADQVFTWHEAADITLFKPPAERASAERASGRDLVWIGNWGDGERTRELETFLIEPCRRLGLSGTVRGVRYPDEALAQLRAAGLAYGGWIANVDVPAAFAAHRVTMHVPRRPYVESLPGIPTIRMFEALACGIPLVSAPWSDAENLFRTGQDYLSVASGDAMKTALAAVLNDPDLAASLSRSGIETIRARHTCGHRVDELLAVLRRIGTERVRRQLPGEQEAAE